MSTVPLAVSNNLNLVIRDYAWAYTKQHYQNNISIKFNQFLAQLPWLMFNIKLKKDMWRSNLQVCLLYPWARHY